jgi:hypothetical protein
MRGAPNFFAAAGRDGESVPLGTRRCKAALQQSDVIRPHAGRVRACRWRTRVDMQQGNMMAGTYAQEAASAEINGPSTEHACVIQGDS